MGTAVVLSVLIVTITFVVRRIIKNKLEGKHCCGGDCNRCGGCH